MSEKAYHLNQLIKLSVELGKTKAGLEIAIRENNQFYIDLLSGCIRSLEACIQTHKLAAGVN